MPGKKILDIAGIISQFQTDDDGNLLYKGRQIIDVTDIDPLLAAAITDANFPPALMAIRTITADYTIVAADLGSVIIVDAVSDVHISIDPTLPSGFNVNFKIVGAGNAIFDNIAGAPGTAVQLLVVNTNDYILSSGSLT